MTASPRPEPYRVVAWRPMDLRERLAEAMRIYADAMGYPRSAAEQRTGYVAAHTRLSGFRAVAALGERDTLLGFGYGYASMPGQWWHDQVRATLDPALARDWLDGSFELCELHVRPESQGHGIGRHMLFALAAAVPQQRILLSTPEGETRAWRLYRSTGFVDLVRHHYFPGDDRPFAVLGVRLPLRSCDA